LVWSGGKYGSRANETLVRAAGCRSEHAARLSQPGAKSNVTWMFRTYWQTGSLQEVQVDGTVRCRSQRQPHVKLAKEERVRCRFPLQAKGRLLHGAGARARRGNGYPSISQIRSAVRAGLAEVMRTRSVTVQTNGPIALIRKISRWFGWPTPCADAWCQRVSA
jgi:uncharacterized protein YfaS (alpha-2-macroglobulin family)